MRDALHAMLTLLHKVLVWQERRSHCCSCPCQQVWLTSTKTRHSSAASSPHYRADFWNLVNFIFWEQNLSQVLGAVLMKMQWKVVSGLTWLELIHCLAKFIFCKNLLTFSWPGNTVIGIELGTQRARRMLLVYVHNFLIRYFFIRFCQNRYEKNPISLFLWSLSVKLARPFSAQRKKK